MLCFNLHAFEFADGNYLLDTAYQKKFFSASNLIESKKEYDIFEGQLELVESESSEIIHFKFRFYLPHKLIKPNLITLTPNIGGLTILEKRLAHTLSSHGYPVLVPFDRAEQLSFDQSTAYKMERIVRRAMAGTLHMIRELKNLKPSINTDQMGVVGASLGGIRSSILYGLDSRFKTAFLSVAGADIPSLYGLTQLEQLVEFRRRHMAALGLTQNENYTEYLRDFIFLEPSLIKNSPHLDGVALIIAEKDTTVPTLNQWKLFSVIKQQGVHPKTYVLDSGHVRGALELIRREQTMLQWLEHHLITP